VTWHATWGLEGACDSYVSNISVDSPNAEPLDADWMRRDPAAGALAAATRNAELTDVVARRLRMFGSILTQWVGSWKYSLLATCPNLMVSTMRSIAEKGAPLG
jgi:hypothetical protein